MVMMMVRSRKGKKMVVEFFKNISLDEKKVEDLQVENEVKELYIDRDRGRRFDTQHFLVSATKIILQSDDRDE